jgi:hypothetical protein
LQAALRATEPAYAIHPYGLTVKLKTTAVFEAAIATHSVFTTPDRYHLESADGAGLNRHFLLVMLDDLLALFDVHVGQSGSFTRPAGRPLCRQL